MELQELIEQIDIVDFISQYVELEERNNEYWGLSPFSNEKTPSFSVNKEKQNFYCFSSGIGGSVFTFTKYYFKCNGYKAQEILLKYAGLSETAVVKRNKLVSSSVCGKYKKREHNQKVSTATILDNNCMDKYVRDSEKLNLWINDGICIDALRHFNVRFDPFSNRIVYPIRSIDGKIVNIGGRTVDPDWKEKKLRKYSYLQSWGTINTIYGLYENMDSIKSNKEIILFEGAKSVMIAYGWGILNTGAILTSHLSANQLKILLKLSSNYDVRVVFALDKDVNVTADRNIKILSRYVDVRYIYDANNLLDEKDSPVDKGMEIFMGLYNGVRRIK